MVDHPKPPHQFEVLGCIDAENRRVYHCWDKSAAQGEDPHVVIKFIPRGKDYDCERVLREVKIGRKLKHSHIVRFRNAHLMPEHLCLVFDYVPGGNLDEYMHARKSTLPEHLARYFFQQIVLVVDFCHRVPPDGIMNRDLKLRNILVDDADSEFPTLSICDFGFGKERDPGIPTISFVGTPNYIAPEIIYRTWVGQRYDGKRTDIYNLGVILHRMLFGEFPGVVENGGNTQEEKLNLLTLDLDPLVQSRLATSSSLGDLMRGLLEPVPSKRWTIEQIYDNEWFCEDFTSLRDLRAYNDDRLAEYTKEWEDAGAQSEGRSIGDLTRLVQRATLPPRLEA